MTSIPMLALRLASGEIVVAHIHGNGGPMTLDAVARMRTAIQRANQGRSLVAIYEPTPGHVMAYRHTWDADHDERVIDIRGAALV